MRQLLGAKRYLLFLVSLLLTFAVAQATTVYVVNSMEWGNFNAWVWNNNQSGHWVKESPSDKLTYYGLLTQADGKVYNIYTLETNCQNMILVNGSNVYGDGDSWSNKSAQTYDIKGIGEGKAYKVAQDSNSDGNNTCDTFGSLENLRQSVNGTITTKEDGAQEIEYEAFASPEYDYIIVGPFSDYSWNISNQKYKMVRHAHDGSHIAEWYFYGEIPANTIFNLTEFNNTKWENKLFIKDPSKNTLSSTTGSVALVKQQGDDDNKRGRFSQTFNGSIVLRQLDTDDWLLVWDANKWGGQFVKHDIYIKGEHNINDGLSWADAENSQKFDVEEITDGIKYTWTGQIDHSGEFKFATKNEELQLGLGSLTDGGGRVTDLTTESGSTPLQRINHHNMRFSWMGDEPVTVKFTLYQKDNGWSMDWEKVSEDPTPVYPTKRDIYIRGDKNINGNTANGWNNFTEDRKFTCDNSDPAKLVYTWTGTIDSATKVNFGNNGGFRMSLAGTGNGKTLGESGTESLKETDGNDITFSWAANAQNKKVTITITQTHEGNADVWSMSWQKEADREINIGEGLDHTLDRFDLFIRGDKVVDDAGWDVYGDNRKLHRVKVSDGYTYTWQGTVKGQGNDNNGLNFGSDPTHNSDYKFGHLELGLSEAKTVLTEKASSSPVDMTYGGYHNIAFSWANNSEIRFTLTQHRYADDANVTDKERARGWWTLEWNEVARPASITDAGGVYLHGSELNNWDVSKRRAFVWDPESKLYVLKYKFENSSIDVLDREGKASSMTSTTLTNFFYIEAFGKKMTVANGTSSPVKTGVSTALISNDEAGKDHTDKSMILEDQALEDVTLYYNPTTNRFRVEGTVSDEIDARKYTIYYKLTQDDVNADGSLKDVYVWAWGNAEGERDVLSTLKNDAINNVDPMDNGNLKFPGIKISDDQHGTFVNADGETYIRYTLEIPEGLSTIGIIFSHSSSEQMSNVLDTDFQDGRIYAWNGVMNQGKDVFFAKVGIRYMDKQGNKAMLLLNTEDGNIYTLDNVNMNAFYDNYDTGFVQDWKGGQKLEEPLFAADENQRASIELGTDYSGFYIVRSPASTETNEYTQGTILDYTYYFTHNGGIAYHKTYNLTATGGQCTHIGWEDGDWKHNTSDPNYNLLTNKPMVFNSEKVDNLSFWFELSTGRLRVAREEGDEAESTERIVLYYKNDTGFTRPCIHVKSVDGKVYTAENRVKGADGQVYTVGEPMHQDDSRLGVKSDYWRYELRVPRYELRKGGKAAEASKSGRAGINYSDDPFISPTNYVQNENLHSNLIITFTDRANPKSPKSNEANFSQSARQNVKRFAQSDDINQLHYAPMIHGGIYTLDNNSNAQAGDVLGQVYLINATDNTLIKTLDQTKAGDYIYEDKNIDLWTYADNGIVKLYVTTAIGDDNTADGVDYGAGSSTNVTSAINGAGHADYTMTYNDNEPYEIDLNDITKDGFSSSSPMAIRVTINPTLHTGGIGFSLNGDDFQTIVGEIEEADGEVMWFNLQGVRLQSPNPGINIRVCGRKTSKVLVK